MRAGTRPLYREAPEALREHGLWLMIMVRLNRMCASCLDVETRCSTRAGEAARVRSCPAHCGAAAWAASCSRRASRSRGESRACLRSHLRSRDHAMIARDDGRAATVKHKKAAAAD